MSNNISENMAAFLGGSSLVTISAPSIWNFDIITPNDFVLAQITGGDFAFSIMVKIFGTIIIAVLGGVFGMLAKDIYKYIIHPKFIKWVNSKKWIKK